MGAACARSSVHRARRQYRLSGQSGPWQLRNWDRFPTVIQSSLATGGDVFISQVDVPYGRVGEQKSQTRRRALTTRQKSGTPGAAAFETGSCKLLGELMVPDVIALSAVVIVLFSSAYFAMASLPFLLVRLDIPEVSRLFRGLFNVYFWMIGLSGLVATTVFAASGRLAFAAAMLSLAATAMALRSRVLRSIDSQQTASQSGDAAAIRQLRLIHWGGMLANAAVLTLVAISVPLIV